MPPEVGVHLNIAPDRNLCNVHCINSKRRALYAGSMAYWYYLASNAGPIRH